MATIIYNKELEMFQMYRDLVSVSLEKFTPFSVIHRNGCMRHINTSMILHFSTYDKVYNRKTKYDFLEFLEKNARKLELPENIAKRFICFIEVDPFIMFTSHSDMVLYFGNDKPVKAVKNVKTSTKHYKMWNMFHGKFGGPYEYTYYKVKEADKLFITSVSSFDEVFPEHNSRKYHYSPEMSYSEYLSSLDVIKCSDDYDFTEEEKAEILERQRKQEEEARKYAEEIERRKRTPGYCQYCGAEHAEYTINPYDEEINDTINYEWICPRCYEDICGDI